MPRPALTEEQRRQNRRQIRDAAAALYAEKGMQEISARAIAERAGVSVGTLYKNFGSLTELMQSLWKLPVRRLLDEFDEIAASQSEPLLRLRTLAEAYTNFAFEHRAVYRGAFLYVRPHAHEKPVPVPLGEDRFYSLLRQTLTEGQAAGVIRQGDPDVLAQNLWAGMHGALALPVNIDRLAFPAQEQMVQQMLDLLFEWLRG